MTLSIWRVWVIFHSMFQKLATHFDSLKVKILDLMSEAEAWWNGDLDDDHDDSNIDDESQSKWGRLV